MPFTPIEPDPGGGGRRVPVDVRPRPAPDPGGGAVLVRDGSIVSDAGSIVPEDDSECCCGTGCWYPVMRCECEDPGTNEYVACAGAESHPDWPGSVVFETGGVCYIVTSTTPVEELPQDATVVTFGTPHDTCTECCSCVVGDCTIPPDAQMHVTLDSGVLFAEYKFGFTVDNFPDDPNGDYPEPGTPGGSCAGDDDPPGGTYPTPPFPPLDFTNAFLPRPNIPSTIKEYESNKEVDFTGSADGTIPLVACGTNPEGQQFARFLGVVSAERNNGDQGFSHNESGDYPDDLPCIIEDVEFSGERVATTATVEVILLHDPTSPGEYTWNISIDIDGGFGFGVNQTIGECSVFQYQEPVFMDAEDQPNVSGCGANHGCNARTNTTSSGSFILGATLIA